jgi:hypothetical protein
MGWISVTVAAAAIVMVGAAPAGAGRPPSSPLHIHKVVVGPVPAGTQFVETVTCDGNIISTGGGPSASSAQLVFDAQGNPVGTGDTLTFTGTGECTVTETQTGGAVSVSYQCESTSPPPNQTVTGIGRFSPRGPAPIPICASDGPQSDPIGVNIVSPGQEATVTVTNTFVEPGTAAAAPGAPAAAVEGEPRFTG